MLLTYEFEYPLPIKIQYTENLDGGGTSFGQEYISIIKSRYPSTHFNKCYEWCSGPGFIGFGLLSAGLCKQLCLSDIYSPAINSVYNTVTNNNLESCVSAYVLSDVGQLPAREQFDLVVANPPHYIEDRNYNTDNEKRICVDNNWDSHKNFFSNIKSHLTKDGVILLQENMKGSTVETFEPFINAAGLCVTDWFKSPEFYSTTGRAQIYYIEIKHND